MSISISIYISISSSISIPISISSSSSISIPTSKTSKISTSNFGLVRLVSLTCRMRVRLVFCQSKFSSEPEQINWNIIGTRTNQSESQSDPGEPMHHMITNMMTTRYVHGVNEYKVDDII